MRELTLRLPWSTLADLGVETLLRHLHDAGDGVRFRSLACHGCSGTCMIEVDEPLDAEAIEALGYVDECDLVGRGPDRFEYILHVEVPGCRDSLDDTTGEFYVDGPVHLADDGMTFTAVATQDGLDRLDGMLEELGDVIERCEIVQVRTYDGRKHRLEPLTDRQREVLTTAFERDYFDVPRGITAEELASEFDLDKSTVLEHLRRAERNLLASVLDDHGKNGPLASQ